MGFFFLMEQVTRGIKSGMGGGWVALIPEGCSDFS